MSTPVRGPAGPLSYAPRWARSPGSNRVGTKVEDTAARDLSSRRDLSSPPDSAPARNVAPVPAPPWKRRRSPAIFAGDIAIKELRAHLALAPDQIPEPPPYRPTGAVVARLPVVARLLGVIVLAAMGVLGFLWIAAPRAAPPEGQITGPAGGQMASRAGNQVGTQAGNQAGGGVALVSYRRSDAMEPPAMTEARKADRETSATADRAAFSVADYARDLTNGAGTAPAVPAPGAVLPAAETRIAPSAALPSGVAEPDREEIEALLARGRAYIAAGDVAAARLVLRRAVEHGDPQAALALGGTYDPIVLKRLGVVSYLADPTQARDWYGKAAELGSTDAPLRLEQLAEVDR